MTTPTCPCQFLHAETSHDCIHCELWVVATRTSKQTTHKGPSELNPTLDSVYDEHGKVLSCTGHLCWASFHRHGDNEIFIVLSLYIYAKSFEKCRECFHHISSSRTGQSQISILESTATKKQLLPPRSNDDMKASKGFRRERWVVLWSWNLNDETFSLPTNSHSLESLCKDFWNSEVGPDPKGAWGLGKNRLQNDEFRSPNLNLIPRNSDKIKPKKTCYLITHPSLCKSCVFKRQKVESNICGATIKRNDAFGFGMGFG